MKNSMNRSTQTNSKEKVANVVGKIARGVAEASSDKCFIFILHEPKMPKSLLKHD